MNRVLIISPDYFHYPESVKNALSEMGYETTIEKYEGPIHPYKGFNKWRYKFSNNKPYLLEKNKKEYNRYLIKQFENYKPDLVFIINGDHILKETLSLFKRKSKITVWMLDSIFHKTGSINHIDYADAMFCFDMKDVEYYKKLNKKSFFLPSAADPKVYYPIETIKDIDISFVGVIYNNEKRIKILKRIISEFPDFAIQFHGIYKPYYKNIFKWVFRENRKIFSNKNLMPFDVNLLYNRSKIVINIHHEQTKYGANPKVYEISATNTYQICDRNPYIESTFPKNQIGLYDNENELINLIKGILSEKIMPNPEDAYINVISNHTIKKRIETIFDILKSL